MVAPCTKAYNTIATRFRGGTAGRDAPKARTFALAQAGQEVQPALK